MKKLLIASAVAAALVAGQASAQMSSSKMSAPQLYVGAGAGRVKNDNREDSWKLYAGYQFDQTWGAEVAYNDLGQYRGADVESWSLAGPGTMPMNEKWALKPQVKMQLATLKDPEIEYILLFKPTAQL